MSNAIGLRYLKIVLGDANYPHFQNWARRHYFSFTESSKPERRGHWKFTRSNALEIALAGPLAKSSDDWKAVRRWVRALLPKIEDAGQVEEAYAGVFLNLENFAIRFVLRSETKVSPFQISELLRQHQSGWVGVEIPDVLRPASLHFLNFDAMRERVDAAFKAAKQDEALLS